MTKIMEVFFFFLERLDKQQFKPEHHPPFWRSQMVCVEAHIIKTVQIYPEDPLFHHMNSGICLSRCHRAAYSQPIVKPFISLLCVQ